MLSLQNPVDGVGDGGERRFDILERRLAQADSVDRLGNRAEDSVQSRVGGERGEKRLPLDQLGGILPDVVDGAVQQALAGEERAAVGTRDGVKEIGAPRQGLGQGGRRFFRAFRRGCVDHGDDQIGALGEERVELHLLLSPRERAGEELTRVGRNGEVAHSVVRGERRSDQKERDDKPGVARGGARRPGDRLGDLGTVGLRHGQGWSASFASGQSQYCPANRAGIDRGMNAKPPAQFGSASVNAVGQGLAFGSIGP